MGFLVFGLFPIKSALYLTAKKVFKTESILKICEGCFRITSFYLKRMVKRGYYYGNESLSLAWDRIKVHQMPLFITTMRLNQVKISCKYHLEVAATLTLRLYFIVQIIKFSI